MDNKEVLFQQIAHGEWHSIQINKVLAQGTTAIQRYRILDLQTYGKTLELNDCIQSTEFDEAIYHESLLLPAIALHGSVKRVLCFGGMNGGILNRLQHISSIEEVVQVDIDSLLYPLTKFYLSHMHPETNGLPFRIARHFSHDPFIWAHNHAKANQGRYDLIIADLPDATSDSYVPTLFTKEFYESIHRLLSRGGIYATQAGQLNPVDMTFHKRTFKTITNCFSHALNYGAFVPSYGNPWGFVVASEGLNLGSISSDQRKVNTQSINLSEFRHYDEQTHQHMFAVSKWHRQILNDDLSEVIKLESMVTVNVAYPQN